MVGIVEEWEKRGWRKEGRELDVIEGVTVITSECRSLQLPADVSCFCRIPIEIQNLNIHSSMDLAITVKEVALGLYNKRRCARIEQGLITFSSLL